jgi:hypothetical protein
LREVEIALADPEYYKDGQKVIETNQEYRALRTRIANLTTEWEGMTIKAEQLTLRLEQALHNLK